MLKRSYHEKSMNRKFSAIPKPISSFGKVLLVEKKSSRKLYAMKCIRKDILIKNDQIENTLLEKDILVKVKHPFLVGTEYIF